MPQPAGWILRDRNCRDKHGGNQRGVEPHQPEPFSRQLQGHASRSLRSPLADPLGVEVQVTGQGARSDAIKPVHQAVRAPDEIRRQQRGHGGDGDGDRVKKAAGDVQSDAEGGNDEGEFADLRQPHPHAQRSPAVVPGDKRPETASDNLAENDDQGNDQDRQPVFPQHLRVNHQANRHEENGAEHVADGFRKNLDAADLARLGDHSADDKRAQGDAVAQSHRQQRETKAESEHGDEQHLVAFEPGDVPEKPRHGQQTGYERGNKKKGEFTDRGGDLMGVERAGHGDARQQRNHHDRQDVFDDEDSENQFGKPLFAFAQLGEGLDDDGGGGNGEHGAEENAVHHAPTKHASHFVTEPYHQQNF